MKQRRKTTAPHSNSHAEKAAGTPHIEERMESLWEIAHQPRLHLNEAHALLLFAILQKCHAEMSRGCKNVDLLPAATQRYLLDLIGLNDRTRLTKMLDPLRARGYVVAGEVHSPEARLMHDNALHVYEINSHTAITSRETAMLLLAALDLAAKQLPEREGAVLRADLIEEFKRRCGETGGVVLAGNVYKGRIEELVDDKINLLEKSEYVEWVTVGLLRPRLRTYLERRYLMLLQEQPPEAEIRKRFAAYRAGVEPLRGSATRSAKR